MRDLMKYLADGELVIEEGSNKLGSYIKGNIGTLVMDCAFGPSGIGYPTQPYGLPKFVDEKIYIGRWR